MPTLSLLLDRPAQPVVAAAAVAAAYFGHSGYSVRLGLSRRLNHWFGLGLWLAFAVTSGGSWAQLVPDDPDWEESTVPSAPAFKTDALLSIDMPPHLSLRFGVDPATVTVTKDGIVRYVVVARSSTGAINAFYEGIRCAKGEFKTYARYNTSGQWNVVSRPAWKPLDDSASSRHTRALAFQAVCEGRTVNGNSVQAIVSALKGRKLELIN